MHDHNYSLKACSAVMISSEWEKQDRLVEKMSLCKVWL